jgi:hypothetical protein
MPLVADRGRCRVVRSVRAGSSGTIPTVPPLQLRCVPVTQYKHAGHGQFVSLPGNLLECVF